MLEDLSETFYVELRRLADGQMRSERRDHTLSATALVHEALLRIDGTEFAPEMETHVTENPAAVRRGILMRAAAIAMRRVLVDHARARLRLKRGGPGRNRQRVSLDSIGDVADLRRSDQDDAVLAFDAALGKLEGERPEFAEVVRLRFFAGYSIDEVAQLLGVSSRTVDNRWLFARAWLARELESMNAIDSRD